MTSPSIDKLPTEILASIFVLLAEELHTVWCQSRCMYLGAYFSDEEFARFTLGQPKSRKVLLLMVCRRWHNIAINCPSLWRYIVVDTYQSTERQLKLAQEAPLDVYTTLSRHDETQTEWGFSLVLGEIHRVQDLVVCAHGRRRVDHEPDNLYMEATAPILRSLSIHHFCNDDDPRLNIVRKIGHEWDAPRLQHYASHGGQEVLSWADPGTHPALRWKDTLTIFVWLPDLQSQNICPSAEALLEVVYQLPHLHTLQVALSPTYPVQPTQPLSERAKINRVRLPGLGRLMLHGNFQSCFDVIDHIDHLHSLRQLVIIAGHPLETPDLRETVPLVDLFAEHLTRDSTDSSEAQAENSKHMRTLYIYPDELKSTSTRILASSKLLNHTVHFPSRSQGALRDIACDGKYPDLDLCLILPQKILRTQFEVLLEGTNFRKVEKLEVHGNPLDEPSDWVIMEYYQPTKLHPEWSSKVFSLLDNVHTLRVHAPIDPGLLGTYLFPTMQDSGRHNFPRLRLARLDEIELEEQTIDRDYWLSGTFKELLHIFERRVDVGLSIENVTISGTSSPLTRVQMVALRRLIPTLLVESIEPRKYEHRYKGDELYSVPESLDGSWDIVLDPNAET